MSGARYDDSVSGASVALTADELDVLLQSDGTEFASARRVRHLLSRMRATFSTHRAQMRDLQRDVEKMHDAVRLKSNPVSYARSALAALTLDEQREVLGTRGQALLDLVVSVQADAARVRTYGISERNRARHALGAVLSDPDLPADLRARLRESLEVLEPLDVPVPAGALAVAAAAELVVHDGDPFAVPPVDVDDGLSDLFADPEPDPEPGPGTGAGLHSAPDLDLFADPEPDRGPAPEPVPGTDAGPDADPDLDLFAGPEPDRGADLYLDSRNDPQPGAPAAGAVPGGRSADPGAI